MTAMSNYLESQLVQHVFRTSSYTKPTQIGIALCTAAPADTDTGTLTGKEVSNAGAYARVDLAPSDSNWANITSGNGTTNNIGAITFTAASADWGTVTHVAITDNSTYGAGQLLFWGSLAGTKVVSNGDTFQFSAAALSIQLDD